MMAPEVIVNTAMMRAVTAPKSPAESEPDRSVSRLATSVPKEDEAGHQRPYRKQDQAQIERRAPSWHVGRHHHAGAALEYGDVDFMIAPISISAKGNPGQLRCCQSTAQQSGRTEIENGDFEKDDQKIPACRCHAPSAPGRRCRPPASARHEPSGSAPRRWQRMPPSSRNTTATTALVLISSSALASNCRPSAGRYGRL